MNVIDNRPIIEKQAYDLIVVGGGIAGISSAVAGARQGLKVLLLEKTISLGGLATIGLISFYEPLCDGVGNQCVFGIGEELIKLSVKDGYDTMPQCWRNKTGERKARYETFYSPTSFTMALDEYVLQNGVDLRFDAHAVFPVMENKVCLGVMVESKGGKEFYPAKTVIDATGDAEIADRAGIPTVVGTNYMLGMAHYTNRQLAKEYSDGANVHKLRKWLYAIDGYGTEDGKKYKGVTSEDITDFVLTGRKAILEKIRQEDRMDREVLTLPQMPQLRTIRRIIGSKIFCATEGEEFEDSIGMCGNWRKLDERYQVPYGSLYHNDFPNLWVAGRIISTDEDKGWEVARVIPTCALTGQAAGVAAALCVKNGYTAQNIPIKDLQAELKKYGERI